MEQNGVVQTVAAIFVDFENLRLGVPDGRPRTDTALDILRHFMRRLERDGRQILIRRCYADWEADGLIGVQGQLSLMSFLPVFVLGQQGKNSADLEMSLDCLQTLLGRDDIQTFVLVAGDRDFIPIVRRILEVGKEVRIASFRNTTSADLVEIAGRRNFTDLVRFVERERPDPKAPRPIEDALAESDESVEVTEADWKKAMQLVVEADRKYRGRGIWLVPFFKEWMNPAFARANNDTRKAILGTLVEKKAITISMKEDGLGRSNSYSVIIPDRECEIYREAEKELAPEEASKLD